VAEEIILTLIMEIQVDLAAELEEELPHHHQVLV
jgi:hypothetical protein